MADNQSSQQNPQLPQLPDLPELPELSNAPGQPGGQQPATIQPPAGEPVFADSPRSTTAPAIPPNLPQDKLPQQAAARAFPEPAPVTPGNQNPAVVNPPIIGTSGAAPTNEPASAIAAPASGQPEPAPQQPMQPAPEALPATPPITPEAGAGGIFAAPTTAPESAPGAPPAPIDPQGTPESFEQSLLSDDEKDDLFGKEKLSGKQKAIIVIIAVVSIGIIFGGGAWIFIRISSPAAPDAVARPAPVDNAESAEATATDQLDSDGDGLSNSKEAELGTDPNNSDSDGDSYSDGDEVKNGFDPLGP